MHLEAEQLWKRFDGHDVVCGVSFALHAGEVVALLGPNGAGKTTTFSMLYGAARADRGRVRLGEWEIPLHGKEAKRHVGVVTQDNNLDPDFNTYENLFWFAHHYGMNRVDAETRTRELLAQFNLQEHAAKAPDDLSGGLRRRLVLARALIHRPRFILLDEPTTGLDPDARQEMWKTVTELKKSGCGILLTTHYMDEAQRLSDRALLMQEGRIIDEGSAEALIAKLIGQEVAEVDGAEESALKRIAEEHGAWSSRLGAGVVIALPPQREEAVWERLEQLPKTGLSRRRANLEDVFLKLTGRGLD